MESTEDNEVFCVLATGSAVLSWSYDGDVTSTRGRDMGTRMCTNGQPKLAYISVRFGRRNEDAGTPLLDAIGSFPLL